LAAVSVRTLAAAADPLSDVAEKAAVTPLGKPAMDRPMAALKPFAGVVVKVVLAVLPAVMFSDVVTGESVKDGAGIASEIASLAVCPPPVAVTVNA
jgi:hypothetical protein